MDMENFLKVRGICSDTTIGTEGDILLSDLLMDYANQSTNNWIKVSERLPESGDSVLVWSGTSTYKSQFIAGRFIYQFENPVTHWQPLPNAPKD